jgi:EPS-associated MarR family transcriptional regulator
MKKEHNITEDHIDLMHIIEKDGATSQRLISQNSGLSIGKVNYCLKALVDIGFIKIKNFNNSNNKLNYAYILTPKGIKEKTAITKKFIIKKQQEYDKLR